VQQMAKAGQHLHSGVRYGRGEPHRVVPWRDHSVAIIRFAVACESVLKGLDAECRLHRDR
jgi:hypothetical protein